MIGPLTAGLKRPEDGTCVFRGGGFTGGVYSAAAEDQEIVLQGVDLRSQLSLAASATEAQLLQEMIARGDYIHPWWESAWFFSRMPSTMSSEILLATATGIFTVFLIPSAM